jgi:preprotein translocase subunit YajC
LEYASVLYYGGLLITTILVVFIAGVVEYVMCRWYHQRKKETQAMVRATGHRVFMRQGSNFITFGGESRKYHVIRKDGVMIETRGALAASTSVNDHHISLEVLDFCPSDSISVTREVDRIVLSVTNKVESFERGTAIITCMDDRNLEKIVVTPTPNGIINVYT